MVSVLVRCRGSLRFAERPGLSKAGDATDYPSVAIDAVAFHVTNPVLTPQRILRYELRLGAVRSPFKTVATIRGDHCAQLLYAPPGPAPGGFDAYAIAWREMSVHFAGQLCLRAVADDAIDADLTGTAAIQSPGRGYAPFA
jgi:hypothetical protein